jgi:hypothetical protein
VELLSRVVLRLLVAAVDTGVVVLDPTKDLTHLAVVVDLDMLVGIPWDLLLAPP